jgi:hypothetical protein
MIEYLYTTFLWPGLVEVGRFLGTHLLSGMLPAFLIAGAIAVFLEKERITRLMGPKANPVLAYAIASFSGALLTVCSCGVIPIFTGILSRGAGTGPAFTFLFSSPAINLIALTYTYTYMGASVMAGRVILVILCSIILGILMEMTFGTDSVTDVNEMQMAELEPDRTDRQTALFFIWLVLIMLTSTGFLDRWFNFALLVRLFPSLADAVQTGLQSLVPKLLLIAGEIVVLAIMSRKWFYPAEIKLWLHKSWSLFLMIFPKVLAGIFVSGIIAALFPLARFMQYFDSNSLASNGLISLVGCTMYFGTIVGVNIVATMTHFGMHLGPAMALLLSGPAISLPSILGLVPIVGKKKALTFALFVWGITTVSGIIFGMIIS